MDIFGLDSYEKPSKKELREDRQREFGQVQKSVMKLLGDNMATLGAILIVIFFVGYIWTDFAININIQTVIIDAVISIACFILMEKLWAYNGIKGGKLDKEYIAANEAYIALRKEVIKLGTTLIDVFCAWQVEIEYNEYIRKKCNELRVDYKDYTERLSKMTLEEIQAEYPHSAQKIFDLQNAPRIELSGQLLLTDGNKAIARRGISISGADYVKQQTVGFWNIGLTVVAAFCSAGVTFVMNDGASWALVMYTIGKLILLAWRIFKGYSEGAKAYNTIEVSHLQGKSLYLERYKEFIENKTYLQLGDRYGEIIVPEEKPAT